MDRKPVLLVFYSRSGRTRSVARVLAASLECDAEELIDATDRRGVRGYLRSALDALLRRPVQLAALKADPLQYDLVIVGTPVWDAAVSAPVRAFLRDYGGQLHRVAFFLTYGGSGARRVFRQMRRLAGRKPLATLAVREVAVRRYQFEDDARRFVNDLREESRISPIPPMVASPEPPSAITNPPMP